MFGGNNRITQRWHTFTFDLCLYLEEFGNGGTKISLMTYHMHKFVLQAGSVRELNIFNAHAKFDTDVFCFN